MGLYSITHTLSIDLREMGQDAHLFQVYDFELFTEIYLKKKIIRVQLNLVHDCISSDILSDQFDGMWDSDPSTEQILAPTLYA